MNYLCHDFKTPRTDTSRRLPPTFRMVPIAFYLALVAGSYFMSMDWLAYQRAQKEKLQANEQKQALDSATAKLKSDKEKLDTETRKGEIIAKWVEGSRNLQPLGVAVARAMPPEVRITDLSIERSDQVPSNLAFSVRINSGTAQEVGLVETSLSRLNYRSLSPQQSKNGDIIEYRSTLVRQDP